MLAGKTREEEITRDHRQRSRIVLIYSIIGPPIGGLIAYFAFMVSATFSEMFWVNTKEATLESLLSLLSGIVVFPLLAYMFGGLQALCTGLLIARIANRDGRFGYLTAFAAAAFIGLLVGLVAVLVYSVSGVSVSDIALAFSVLWAIGVASSLLLRCWFRGLFAKS